MAQIAAALVPFLMIASIAAQQNAGATATAQKQTAATARRAPPLGFDRRAVRSTVRVPGNDWPLSIALSNGSLWAARGAALDRLDRKTGKVLAHVDLPGHVVGLAADGRFLYALDVDWESGQPILLIDPLAARIVDHIAAPAFETAAPAIDLAWHGGTLYVLDRRRAIHAVDPKSGALLRTLHPALPLCSQSLGCDGDELVVGAGRSLSFLDVTTGRRQRFAIVPLAATQLAFAADTWSTVANDPTDGALVCEVDRARIESVPVVELLVDEKAPFTAHTVGALQWEIGGERLHTLEELAKKLTALRDAVAVPGTEPRPAAACIQTCAGTFYSDVETTRRALVAAGFRRLWLDDGEPIPAN